MSKEYDEFLTNSKPYLFDPNSALAKRLRRHDWNWRYRENRLRVLTKDLIGYKRTKVVKDNWKERRITIALLIPKGTIIHCSGRSRKCRASRAVVLDTYQEGESYSLRDSHPNFKYEQGKIMRPKKPFSLSLEECASGIHFFWEAREAQRYNLN